MIIRRIENQVNLRKKDTQKATGTPDYQMMIVGVDRRIDARLLQISELRKTLSKLGGNGYGPQERATVDRIAALEREVDTDIDLLVDMKRAIPDLLESIS